MGRSNFVTKKSEPINSVEDQRDPSDPSTQLDILTIAFILVTWVFVFPLLVPTHTSDRGVFVDVAERLLAGDRLYAEVYDNKDPLFFYFVAAQRILGGFGEIAFEGILVIIAAASSFALAQLITTKRYAAAVSFVAVPIILTGTFYFPGCTELPGVSLSLAACAFVARRRLIISGVCIGLLVFTKEVMVPVAVVAVACIFLARFRPIDSYKLVLPTAVTIFGIGCILLARSEFWPFVKVTIENIRYSQNPVLIDSNSLWTSVTSRLHRISSSSLYSSIFSFLVSLFLVLSLLSQHHRKRRLVVSLITASVASFVVAAIVLALTGLWDQHNQILYIPSVLIAICVSAMVESGFRSARPILLFCLSVNLAFLLGGSPGPGRYLHKPMDIIASVRMLDAIPPAAKRLLRIGSTGAYARLGPNDDYGHAFGLNNWKLVCPRFHQYSFQSAKILNEVLSCAASAPTLIVTESFAHEEGRPIWNQFIDNGETLLRSSYSCDAESGLRICTRVGGRTSTNSAPSLPPIPNG
jgi:hypothetical protein